MKLIIAIGLLLPSVSAWGINKCTGPNGNTAYQQHPCDGGKPLGISATPSLDLAAKKEKERQESTKKMIDRMVAQQIAARSVAGQPLAIGMTGDQVRAAWGEPQKINVTVTKNARTEQWVYKRGSSRTQYAYMENGLLRSFQSTE